MYNLKAALMDRFKICHAITAKWEGGWSDHPADPGGKTMYGVTEAVYHAWLRGKGRASKPVRDITMTEALEIYRDRYWLPTAVRYRLRPGVDLATYDAGVNAGVSRAIGWLAKAQGGPDHQTVKKICAARLSFKQALSTWKTFGKGWTRRVADIEAKGVAMALAVAAEIYDVQQQLEDEAQEVKKKSAAQEAGGIGAGGGAAGGGAVSTTNAASDPAAGWILLALVLAFAGAAAFLIWRARINRERAAAYQAEAEDLAS